MSMHIRGPVPIAFIAAALLALGCSDSNSDEPNDSDNEGTPDGGAPNNAPNPVFPDDLNDAVDALTDALGDQPNAGDAKIAVVANRHSNYWTPAQIGTGRAASVIGCYSSFDATNDGMNASQ